MLQLKKNNICKVAGRAAGRYILTAQTILKSHVKSMSPMPVSLMPEGLETSINQKDMGDLLEYKTLK
jgi:hypothetical protein